MKYFVRLLSALLILAMAFSIVACSDEEKETEGKGPSGTLDFDSEDPSGSDTEDPSGGSEEPSEEESESKENETVDMSTYEAPTVENPTLSGFELPSSSKLELSTVEPTAAEDCTVVTKNAADIHVGSLILVNPQFALKKDPADIKDALVNMFEHRANGAAKGKYQLPGDSIRLQGDAIEAFTSMMVAANTQNAKCSGVLVSEAYRSAQIQEDHFNAAGGVNAMQPNHSDFQTGYSLHLKYYGADKLTYTLGDKNNADAKAAGAIIADLADDYGFIQRYPAGKSAFTGVSDNVLPHLYRYVGVPHARIMNDGNYTLEEYLEGIKAYTATKPLRVEDGAHVYHVFYVPVAEDAETVSINVPKNRDYTISGNNVDGFIVTVTIS